MLSSSTTISERCGAEFDSISRAQSRGSSSEISPPRRSRGDRPNFYAGARVRTEKKLPPGCAGTVAYPADGHAIACAMGALHIARNLACGRSAGAETRARAEALASAGAFKYTNASVRPFPLAPVQTDTMAQPRMVARPPTLALGRHSARRRGRQHARPPARPRSSPRSWTHTRSPTLALGRSPAPARWRRRAPGCGRPEPRSTLRPRARGQAEVIARA